ncbi:hypothetical protein [Paenibacillus sp. QZ-Y1]|uniref:hypothetical protein n=1 Tax=Paenibacillus sp. QZ-Y1 TaxID=3414511 RepID=UPI003F7B2DE4
MAKHKLNQSHVLKINSTRISKEKYNLTLPRDQARENKEIVSLGSSQALRFIQEWEGNLDRESEIHRIKMEIKRLRKLDTNKENKRNIASLYKELNERLYNQHYVMIVMKSKKDFDRLCSKKGFKINGHSYKRLLATTGGGKDSTVVFVTNDVYPYLKERLNMGRDMTKKMVPAKLEAYQALACSASTPVSRPKGVLIVQDAMTSFKSNVITIDDRYSDAPVIEEIKDYSFEGDSAMNASDGFGLMLPDRSRKWSEELGVDGYASMVERHGYTKGVLHPFDFLDYAENIAKSYMVQDAWGVTRDIRDYDVILTTSMMKLWDSYTSLEHVQECWDKFGYAFAVTKTTPENLDNEGDLNYQFIQSLKLSDNEIDQLISLTVNEIKEVLGGDYRKTLLYLRGKKISEKDVLHDNPDFIQALMIDKEIINDPFVRNHVYKMIHKRIDEAKTGVLRVKGNFSMMSGDPYTLCQNIFGMPLTGLLKGGEYYSNYWLERKVEKIAAFRAPMTNHNNIRVFRMKKDKDTSYWYRYMKNVTILNSWDTATHALNGADFDGDQVFTTDDEVIMNNVHELDALVCMQKPVGKVVPTEADLIAANKASFGDEIGITTNRITSMFDVMAGFTIGSDEYLEVNYRIMSGQMIQQNVIDKAKGMEAKGMPKEWYTPKLSYTPIVTDEKGKAITDENGKYIPLPETDEDRTKREFNLSIVVDKKPYFFIWKKDSSELGNYKKYIKAVERNCSIRFGISFEELKSKTDLTEKEKAFLEDYYRDIPVSIAQSTMNRICWRVEEAFKDVPRDVKTNNFDKEILKTDKKYSQVRFKEIKELYKNYSAEVKSYILSTKDIVEDSEAKEEARRMFLKRFREKALSICNNEEDLCNMVVDLCYKTDNSKQFAWDVAGKQIIFNLLRKNRYTFNFPVLDEKGEIEYSGDRFKMVKIQMEVDNY